MISFMRPVPGWRGSRGWLQCPGGGSLIRARGVLCCPTPWRAQRAGVLPVSLLRARGFGSDSCCCFDQEISHSLFCACSPRSTSCVPASTQTHHHHPCSVPKAECGSGVGVSTKMSTTASTFHILVLENHSPYDCIRDVSAENAVEDFMKMCREYASPEYNTLENTSFMSETNVFCSYSAGCGNDKPMMILMMGPITPDMIALITHGLKGMYITRCQDCSEEISITRTLCKVCIEK